MTPNQIVHATLAAIAPTGLDYVLVGAFATGYYAFPRSTKDAEDVRNILSVQGHILDYPHIEAWCARHGTLDRLAEVRAGIPPGL